MSSRSPGAWQRRLARWLGYDRNPLRRTTDRVEAVLRLAIGVLIVVAIPVAVIAAGRSADHAALRETRAQAAATYSVQAVLVRQAPPIGTPDPYSGVDVSWVRAHWAAPHGPARTGDVLAPAGAPKGSTVRMWVDASGDISSPPPGRGQVVGDVFIAATLAGLGVLLVLLAAEAVGHRILQRRRLNAWDTEWRAVAPRWTGHRT